MAFSITVVFFAGIAGLNRLFHYVNDPSVPGEIADLPWYWPVSIFSPGANAPPDHVLPVAGATSLAFLPLAYYVYRERYASVLPVVGIGSGLLLLSNYVHGREYGYEIQLTGTYQYYGDVARIDHAVSFVSSYQSVQTDLALHSQTHPPGSVLTFYVFEQLLGLVGVENIPVLSASIGLVSLLLSSYFLYRLLSLYYRPETTTFVVALFVVLPAVQIYYLTTLDAVIASFFTGALFFAARNDGPTDLLLTASCVTIISFQTFLFVAIYPVLLALAFRREDGRVDLAALLPLIAGFAGPVLFYLALYATTGFSYLGSFLIASAIENSDGFLLFRDPLTYLVTRLEGVTELLLFFSPVLAYTSLFGVKPLRERQGLLLATIAIVVAIGGLLTVGVYRTGETARSALFVYPLLLVPIAALVDSVNPRAGRKLLLLSLVFLQTLVMQAVGFYYW